MHRHWNLNKFSIANIGAAALALAIVGSFTIAREIKVQHAASLDNISSAIVEAAFISGQDIESIPNVAGLVLPHHLVAANLLGRVIGAARDARPQTIVVIGPDHINRSASRFTTSQTVWGWQEQNLVPSQKVITALLSEPEVRVDELLITDEHSVLTPLPFLHRQFPGAQFVLLTVQSDFDAVAAQRMAALLDRTLGKNDLVVASVDFSHYKTLEVAKAEDAISLAALAKAIPSDLKGIPADSPMSLAIAMAFAHLRGANQQTIIDHSNSAELTGNLAETSTTSYIDVVFHGR